MTKTAKFSTTSKVVIIGAAATILLPFAFAAASNPGFIGKDVDLACAKAAVEKREDSIIAAFAQFNADIADGLTTRRDKLETAWDDANTVTRKSAISATWKEWKATKKSAHADLKSTRKAAWSEFKTTMKSSCKIESSKDDAEEKDSKGTLSL